MRSTTDLRLKPTWERALRLFITHSEAVCSIRTFAGQGLAEIQRGAARALRNRGLIEPSLPHRNPEWYRLTPVGRAWLRDHQ